MNFLNEEQLEKILQDSIDLKSFWEAKSPLLIFRSHHCQQDPIYEVQLAWDLGDRVETFGWLWVDAFEGKIVHRL